MLTETSVSSLVLIMIRVDAVATELPCVPADLGIGLRRIQERMLRQFFGDSYRRFLSRESGVMSILIIASPALTQDADTRCLPILYQGEKLRSPRRWTWCSQVWIRVSVSVPSIPSERRWSRTRWAVLGTLDRQLGMGDV